MAVKDQFGFPVAEFALEDAAAKQFAEQEKSTFALDFLVTEKLGNLQAVTDPVSEPVYTKAAERFGTLSHISPISEVESSAAATLDGLRDQVQGEADDSLFSLTAGYVEAHKGDADLAGVLGEFIGTGGAFKRPSLPTLADKLAQDSGVTHNEHTKLFKVGQTLLDHIRTTEKLRHGLVRLRRRKQQLLARKEQELKRFAEQIVETRKRLANAERERLERLDDYVLAQRLVSEDWQRVVSAFEARRDTLLSHRGLYYVRVRETPLSTALPDPLRLRPGQADDVVPGCNLEDVELPDELAPFLEAVLDLPVGEWAALRPLYHLLPPRNRLLDLVDRRVRRLRERTSEPAVAAPPGQGGLAELRAQNLGLLRELASRRVVPNPSLVQLQKDTRDLLSLEDLLRGPPHRMRGPAERLRRRLDGAAACLMDQLRPLSPSLRLAWSEAAEADRLDVSRPETWPGLERAEERDFNRVRTLVELVRWWFRQLHDGAGSASRTAVRNLVRASLMIAASDDPTDLLHGSVASTPGLLRTGAVLRLALNREAPPGTLLALTDTAQQVVGTLRVDDHDASGAVASVVEVHAPETPVDTRFRVTGGRGGAPGR